MKIGILVRPIISEVNLKVINTIIEDEKFRILLAIIDCRPKLSFKEKIQKNIKRGRGGYILIMFFNKLFSKKGINYDTIGICNSKGIGIIETNSPYSPETISGIREYGLDILLLINGYGIIKKDLLNITPLGILSYHHGNLRKYRGMPPAFWELYNNEKEIGVTVQKLETGLDCGIPIEESSFQVHPTDTLKIIHSRIYNESIGMMHSALIKLSDPDFDPPRIDSLGKLYTLPNLRQWLIFKSRMFGRRIMNV